MATQTLNQQVSALRAASNDERTFIFAGAGAGVDLQVPESLRLPLGQDLMRELLSKRYPHFENELPRLTQEFESEYRTAATPDQVWHALIDEEHQLRDYALRLAKLFPPDQPIPATYYLLARWFFTASNVGGLATTNFDEKLDDALVSVGRSMNRVRGHDYHIAGNPDGFDYFEQTNLAKVVQKIHGTISQPWTLVGGYKRRVKTGEFKPYLVLKSGLKAASNWVFIGYKFLDNDLVDVLCEAATLRKDPPKIYIISRTGIPQSATRLSENCEGVDLIPIRTTADQFLRELVLTDESGGESAIPRSLEEERRIHAVQLAADEKIVLTKGPVHIEGCVKRHKSKPEPMFDDIIHGSFQFSAVVRNYVTPIIDSGEVQRLRNIKQLSFVHLKFPNASHDRFSHTLGVARLADEYVELRNRGGTKDDVKQQINPEDHRAFCIASLLHDIGHGPLGHTIDLVRDALHLSGSHENDSVRLLQQAKDNRAYADLDLALEDAPVAHSTIKDILLKRHPLSVVLSNDGIDIDRLDFILRDAWFTLMAKSDTSLDPLKESVRILHKEKHRILEESAVFPGSDGNPGRMAYYPGGREHLKHAASVYAFLYTKVYYCWENLCAQAMISLAIRELRQSGKFTVQDILRLTDVELFAAMEDFGNPFVREMAYLVKYRRLYNPIGEVSWRGGRAMSQTDVANVLQIQQKDRYRVLYAAKGAKSCGVFFVGLDGAPQATAERLSETPNRVLLFGWPHDGMDGNSMLTKITDFAKAQGGANVECLREQP